MGGMTYIHSFHWDRKNVPVPHPWSRHPIVYESFSFRWMTEWRVNFSHLKWIQFHYLIFLLLVQDRMLSGYLVVTKRLEIIFFIEIGSAKSSYSFCLARLFNGTTEKLLQLIRNKYPRAGTNLFTWNPIFAYVSCPYCTSPPNQHPKAPKAFNFRKRCRKVVYSLLNFNHLLALEAHECAAPFPYSKVFWKRFTLISNKIHLEIIIFIHGAWES